MSYPGEIRTIILFTPVTLEGGAELSVVHMREPLVRDRISLCQQFMPLCNSLAWSG